MAEEFGLIMAAALIFRSAGKPAILSIGTTSSKSKRHSELALLSEVSNCAAL